MADIDENETPKDTNDEGVKPRKEDPESVHFGDAEFDNLDMNEVNNATWGEVCTACCVHDGQTWFKIFIGACVAMFFLYFFLVALELLGQAAKVLSGCTAGGLFGNTNPVAALVVGELATALIQSSSTTTSIIVSLVGAGAIPVESAIYMVMGANIGTSVTNTIVAMGQMGDGAQLERAFAGATVHDCFNLLSVLVLFPLEIVSHLIFHITKAMLPKGEMEEGETWESPISAMIDPITARIIKSNKSVITDVATGKVTDCNTYYPVVCIDNIEGYKQCTTKCGEGDVLGVDCGRIGLVTCDKQFGCPAFFQIGAVLRDDTVSGGVCLFLSLVLLIGCLIGLVNVLQMGLKGMSTRVIYKATNVNSYLAMVIGAGITMLVQSSSITTSVLTPLVGLGAIRLEQMFPLTLGANIGTTVTGLLAAMVSADPNSLQVALSHLMFNVLGIIIWYPIPFMRSIPLGAARWLGRATRRTKYVAPIYVVMAFFVIPLGLLGITSLFGQDSLGMTVIGVFVVLFIVYMIAKFVWYLKRRDGVAKTLAYFDKRQKKADCMSTLPEDVLTLKADNSMLKRRCAALVEHTGMPIDDEEGFALEKDLDDDKELSTPAPQADITEFSADREVTKESILSA